MRSRSLRNSSSVDYKIHKESGWRSLCLNTNGRLDHLIITCSRWSWRSVCLRKLQSFRQSAMLQKAESFSIGRDHQLRKNPEKVRQTWTVPKTLPTGNRRSITVWSPTSCGFVSYEGDDRAWPEELHRFQYEQNQYRYIQEPALIRIVNVFCDKNGTHQLFRYPTLENPISTRLFIALKFFDDEETFILFPPSSL